MRRLRQQRGVWVISLDTETTGVDFHHGARPYYVTLCREDGTQQWWEWDVDPLTRKPIVPPDDAEEVRALLEQLGRWGTSDEEIAARHRVVLQNAKFDAAALTALLPDLQWPWPQTDDTLVAGHLLASNQPHDLTSMALHYLGIDIEPYEKKLEEACKEARRLVQQAKLRKKREKGPRLYPEPLSDWKIAEPQGEGTPSAKEKSWKYDTWLPKAVAKELKLPKDHSWWTVLRDYANTDSAVTLVLWNEMKRRLEALDLWEIYLEKKKSLEALTGMERRGVTVLIGPLTDLRKEYETQSEELSDFCTSQAVEKGHDLALPKGSANNKSLHSYLFDVLKLPVLKWTDTGKPAFDKEVIEEYKRALQGPSLDFVRSLSRRRKRQKSLEFLASYRLYGIGNIEDGLLTLHPSLNPTATATTRLSCNNPNLQQVSKQETACELCDGEGCQECHGTGQDLHSVRKVFGPGPGREWWTADAENIELRIPAYVSGQPELIALFEKPNDPPFFGSQHLLNFSIVYPDLWAKELSKQEKDKGHIKEKYGADWYQSCKNGGFAKQYRGGKETVDRTFRRRGSFDRLSAKLDRLEALDAKLVAEAHKLGYVETLPDKSVNPKRGYPLLCSRTEYGKPFPTLPLNYMVQGTAGWWMVKAINRCHAQLKAWQETGFSGRLVLTVHDELVFDFPKGGLKNLPKVKALKALMELGGQDIGVPTTVSLSYHPKNWAEKAKLSPRKNPARTTLAGC